jgi:hypothetical protein
MVKKVSGPGGPRKPEEVSSVRQASEVRQVSEISGVKKLGSVGGLGGLGSVSGTGTKLTTGNQEEVLKTIETEAEKMFAGKRIPRKRQKTITDALKMAVIAATIKEEDS